MSGAQSTAPDWRHMEGFSAATFDIDYSVRPGKTILRIWRDAYGDDYPAEAEPNSFVTKTDLERMARLLALGAGDVLGDLGCGRGGPGLWLARTTGADLIGIDYSPNAIALANQRCAELGLEGHCRFLLGDVCATGLPERSFDGAVSIDVIVFVQDKAAVMREAARILRPGAALILTAWENSDAELYRRPLLDNGFTVEVYEEKPDWRPRQLAVYEGILAERAALLEEMGEEAARSLIDEAEVCLADGMANSRHILIAARKL